MQKNLLVILFCLLSTCLFAQDDEDDFEPDNYNKAFILKTAPMMVFNYQNGAAITLGIEHDLSRNYSMTHEIGVLNEAYDFVGDYISLNGFLYKNQCSFFIFNSDDEMKFILGPEFSFSYMTYERHGRFEYDDLDYFLFYQATRWYAGLALNFGGEYRYPKGLVVEYYLGLGTRINYVDSDLTNEDIGNLQARYWSTVHRWNQREGLNLIPKFNFGLRLGYNFKREKK